MLAIGLAIDGAHGLWHRRPVVTFQAGFFLMGSASATRRLIAHGESDRERNPEKRVLNRTAGIERLDTLEGLQRLARLGDGGEADRRRQGDREEDVYDG